MGHVGGIGGKVCALVDAELVRTLVQLSVWAQLGVLCREYLTRFFVNGCDGVSWGPCCTFQMSQEALACSIVCLGSVCRSVRPSIHLHLTLARGLVVAGGVYFSVLPANMLGTFIIGLMGTSAMVKLDERKAVAVLGPDHPWQTNGPLQAGVRTGLCGSITTFSWMLEAMETCLTGNQWLTGIGQIVVGLACAVVSYAFGIQCALLVHHHVWKEEAMEDEMLSFERKSASFVFGRGEGRPGGLDPALEELEVDLPRQEPLTKSELRDTDFAVGLVDSEVGNSTRGGSEVDGPAGGGGGAAAAEKEVKRGQQRVFEGRTEWVAFVSLVLLTIGSCFGVAYETEHTWVRKIWLAVLFAPFGCVSRWLLAKLNYSLRSERFRWVPLGTLAANWIGVVIDYVLAAITIRTSPGYWGSLIIGAIEDGFCGCLTTVSTLISEIMTFADLLPFSARVYVYAVATFVGAFVWGLAFLGWSFWTT